MEPTNAEARILDYVAHAKSNKEIARALHIEVSTVKLHLHRAYRKIGARNRVHAAIIWRARAELREIA
jgi:two-component system, NarL family, nitrate/nitrite response regulator NarL